MNKKEFINKLRAKLLGFPKKDVDERLGFYSEMIDDRIEEGLTESEAVAAVGSVDTVAVQIVNESPLYRRENHTPKKGLKVWEIVLIAIGSPVWLALLVAAFAVIFSLYAVMWALLLVLWVVELPFFVFSYISKYLFIICKKATECSLTFTKMGVRGISKFFSRG